MIGICPKCGDKVVEGESSFFCRSNDCAFRIGKTILEQPINCAQASKLLSKKRSDLLDGFVSKSGKKFPAYLVMDVNGKITFEFPEREPESEAEPKGITPRSDENLECKQLINAATRNLYRNNAFRITGLPIDATNREISKHVEKLKMMAELGQTQIGDKGAFALNPPPTTDDIREAIQKLKDPELRVIDEFFWFWPAEFGKGQQDPAIQALAKNDSHTAHQIWRDEIKNNRTDGIVAKHNLAVLWHLHSLESELELLSTDIPKEPNQELSETERNWRENFYKTPESKTQEKTPDIHGVKKETEGHWRESFKYWEHLVDDDVLWGKVGERIRQIDDARLTVGYHRRMRCALPEALDKINAELALLHAEKGNLVMARFHVQLMRETNQGLDNVEKTADLVLSPVKSRLRSQIQQTKKLCDNNPEKADEAARDLLKHARPLLDLFELFYDKTSHVRCDLFDEVANAVTDAAVDHQKKSGDNKTFITLLEQAQQLANSEELKLRINNNLRIGKDNLAFEHLEPAYALLHSIDNSKETILEKLDRIKHELIPKLKTFENERFSNREALDKLYSSAALTIRSLSIDANNNLDDAGLALEIIELAACFATEHELKEKIADDIRQITQIKQKQDARNVALTIRDDRIEVTRTGIRHNQQFIKTNEINAVKFGIGVFDVYCHIDFYTLGVKSLNSGEINIDFKKVLRSKDQARKDLVATLDGLFYHIVPSLSTRIAKQILAGRDEQIGDCWLTAKGVRGTVGALLWKDEIVVPWTEVRYGVSNGYLAIGSSKTKNFIKKIEVRTVWNAGIFEEIIKAITSNKK